MQSRRKRFFFSVPFLPPFFLVVLLSNSQYLLTINTLLPDNLKGLLVFRKKGFSRENEM